MWRATQIASVKYISCKRKVEENVYLFNDGRWLGDEGHRKVWSVALWAEAVGTRLVQPQEDLAQELILVLSTAFWWDYVEKIKILLGGTQEAMDISWNRRTSEKIQGVMVVCLVSMFIFVLLFFAKAVVKHRNGLLKLWISILGNT